MPLEPKSEQMVVRMTAREMKLCTEAAHRNGLYLAEWVRAVLIPAARKDTGELLRQIEAE